MASKEPARIYRIGPADAPITIFYANGFIGVSGWSAGLDLEARTIRKDSMLGAVFATGRVRVVLFEHPARLIDQSVDFPEITRHLGSGLNILSGLSRGAQLTGQYHRWLIQQGHPMSRIRVVLISPPPSVDTLVQANMTRAIGLAHVPCSLGGPLIRHFGEALFYGKDVQPLLTKAGRADDISSVRESIRRSDWVIATTRELWRFRGFGPVIPSSGIVVVANVPNDEVVHVDKALTGVKSSYPGCHEFMLQGTSGHGRPDMDLDAYRELWEYIYELYA